MEPKSKDLIDSLRLVADFLEANPEVELVTVQSFYPTCDTREDLATIARKHGPFEKYFGDQFAGLKKNFGKMCSISWLVERNQVCRLVETREKCVIPAQPAHEAYEAEIVVKREWVCDEPLLSEKGGES